MGHITNTTSTLFGYFARFRFPKIIQIVVNKTYASMFKIDLSEFDELNSYDSLNALFTRKLKTPRKISDQAKDIISPCDGLITQVGKISSSKALQIKAREYDIKTLLTQYSLFASKYSSRFEDGHYMNFYLSPKDYHCYHSPCDLTIHKSIHISGRLFPVNLKFLHKTDELFNNNERVILECSNQKNHILYLVFVGALNVGQMRFSFDDRVSTNRNNAQSQFNYDDIQIKKGDLLGNFEMGSTIVMITQKGFLEPLVQEHQNIKFADVIAKRL